MFKTAYLRFYCPDTGQAVKKSIHGHRANVDVAGRTRTATSAFRHFSVKEINPIIGVDKQLHIA
jgi:hypothetical protein